MNEKTKAFYGENLAKESNSNIFVGIDEVGRGALAGPVVASSVYLNKFNLDFNKNLSKVKDIEIFRQIKDSKKINEKKRNYLYDFIDKNMI